MSKSIGAREAQEFLEQAARHFQKRPTSGEDMSHWSNVANSENCRAIADLIEQQGRLIQDMFVVLINRCDEKDTKVKEVLIRAIEIQPDTPEEGE